MQVDIPSPVQLRGGWAAHAAICASKGWSDVVHATTDEWLYHDGGGNWACLRFIAKDKIVLVGHDHEYSETYFRESAQYFGKAETDLLRGAPDWWGQRLDPRPFGEWIGFVHGWNGHIWQRARYDAPDGFDQVGLLRACGHTRLKELKDLTYGAPGLRDALPSDEALRALICADARIDPGLLASVVLGRDVAAGIAAARNFLDMPL
jgi:hypothetical protein